MAENNGYKKGTAVFYKEWWERLSYKPDALRQEIIERFFNHCFDIETFNPDAFDKKNNRPTDAEFELIFMVRTFEKDKESYDAKCEQKRINATRKNPTETEEQPQATASDSKQPQATANNRKRPQANINDRLLSLTTASDRPYYDNDNDNDNDYFFSQRAGAHEEREKKEILFDLSLFFVEKGALNPWTAAEKAWNYNESQGWKATIIRGKSRQEIDHSKDKLAFMKGWDVEGAQYGLDGGQMFADFCRTTKLTDPEIIDDFHGTICSGDMFTFLFNRKKTCEKFYKIFRNNQDLIDQGHDMLKEKYNTPSSQGFRAEVYPK